jgi:hypothetical protein
MAVQLACYVVSRGSFPPRYITDIKAKLFHRYLRRYLQAASLRRFLELLNVKPEA